MKTGLTGSFGRMNERERTLVTLLLGILSLLIIGGGIWYVSSSLNDKEQRIKKNQKSWSKIQKKASAYLEKRAQREALTAKIKENPNAESPDSPISQAAVRTRVRYRTASSTEDETAMLNKILHPTGDVIERPLITKGRRKTGPQYYRVAKQFNMKRGFAQVDDLWKFLGTVEDQNELVFVSKLHLVRWSRDPDYAQIRGLTASTIRFEETSEEEEE